MTRRRSVRSLPLAVRARRLRLAGLADTNRIREEWTLSMVGGDAVPVEIEQTETVRIPTETMRQVVFGGAQ